MRAMSTTSLGRASRMAMSGTSVCPPAMIRTSSSAASIAHASSRFAGRAYSNEAGFIRIGASACLGADQLVQHPPRLQLCRVGIDVDQPVERAAPEIALLRLEHVLVLEKGGARALEQHARHLRIV